jgi:hypothetical protein
MLKKPTGTHEGNGNQQGYQFHGSVVVTDGQKVNTVFLDISLFLCVYGYYIHERLRYERKKLHTLSFH